MTTIDPISAAKEQAPAWAPVRIAVLVMILCAVYVVSMFLRGSVTVFAPDLARQLNIPPERLGFLSSVYFLSFAFAQIPVGIAIDRFGARLTIVGSTLVACLGCLWFAVATHAAEFGVARALMGIGCAALLMGPVTIYGLWFSTEKLSFVTGIQLGVGTIGSLSATAPLAFLVHTIGLQASFIAVASIGGAIALLVLLFVHNNPPDRPVRAAPRETFEASLRGVVEAARTPSAWRLLVIQFAAYPSFAAILTLWGGPWLADVYGMAIDQRGSLLFLLAGAQAIGLFLWGPTDRLIGSFKRPVMLGTTLSVGLLTIAAAIPLPREAIGIWLVAFGLTTAFLPVMVAHGRALFPDRLIGRGITFINVGTFAGAFFLQYAAGHVIGWFQERGADGRMISPALAYQAMFAMFAVILAIALVAYAGARDPRAEASGTARRGRA